MAKKLIPLIFTSKIPTWVVAVRPFSTVCGANRAQNGAETYQKVLNRAEIDPRIQSLRNDLSPDSLIRVLDTTHDLNSALKVFKWAALQKQFRHTASTYCSVIFKLGFAGNVDELEGFCREMVRDKCQGAEAALGELVDVFVGSGRLDEAVRVVLVMSSSGYKLCVGKWNCVLSRLVEGKRGFRDVLLVYKEMVKSGTLPDVETLNCLIKALFDADMVDKAVDQFRRMGKKGCVPNCRTFEIVVRGLVAANAVDESLVVMGEMFENGMSPDLSFCTNVIPLFCKENKVEEAMKLFDVMSISQLEPDFCAYAALIKCLCVNLRFSEATELFDKMRNAEFSFSADVLADLVNAHCKLGNLDEARKLLNDNPVLDPSPFIVLLQGYCDAHQFLSAKELLQSMLLVKAPDNLSWNILIEGLCNAKYVKQTYEVLGKMITSGYAPDFSTYSTLVAGKCDLSKYDDAMELFQQVSKNEWIMNQNSYTKLIRGLCSVEKYQEASEVFMYMSARNCTLHCSLLSGLIKGFSATGRVDEAIRLLKCSHCCKNPVNTSAYSTIMHGLLKLNRPYDSVAVLSQILRRGLVLDVEAYCIVIQCMIVLCQTRSCVLFLDLMVNESLFPDHDTMVSLLSHLADHSQLHTIWTQVNKTCQESEVLDAAMYNMLINGLCKEGYKTEACQLLDYMLEKGWVPDASTHGLLVGSLDRQEAELQTLEPADPVMQDEVSSILSEGLEET